jgi:hypothetical protein
MKLKRTLTKPMVGLTTVIFLSILISACSPKEPTVDINAERTGFAQTAMIQGTETAQVQPTATETLEPTPTLTQSEESVEITPTAGGTTAVSPTVSATTAVPISGADAGVWLANDPPDNTEVVVGEAFTITWTLENIGTSTWTTGYYILFTSGDRMGAPEKVFLPYDVPPGTNVQISVDFEGPESTGEKQSNWSLVNANDQAFYAFWVKIIAVEQDE